ncbi:MAG: glycosyltransferase family 39 protein [Rhodocyclaceae bacterium]|nr:glycosyltransferase family 39 protein [Rhodocyclaceae bacterium]
MSPYRSESLTIPFWLPLLLVAAYLALGLSSYGLLDNNEGLYAEIAREMGRGASLVIPHLIGEPYLEKPPLLYYLVAAAFRLFGETEAAARAVPLLASLACLWSVHGFCARLGRPQTGRLAVLILGSSLGYVLMSRVVMFDMLFTAFFNFALLGFFLAWRESNRWLLRLSHACLALALLTKGFLALILFGLILVPCFLVRGRRSLWQALRFFADPLGLALFLALALPWHVIASLEHPRFAWFYFINEHVLRFLGKRIPQDYYSGSVAYYLPRLLVFLFPWAFHLALTLFRRGGSGDTDKELAGFLWAAWLAPLLFFSLSSAKANYYMVVAMPALALIIAWRIQELAGAGRARLLAWPSGLILGFSLILLTALGIKSRGTFDLAGQPDAALRVAVVAAFLALAWAGFWLALKRQTLLALVATALLLAPIEGYLLHGLAAREAEISARPLARAITERCPGCRVMIYRDFEAISSLAFYLEKPPLILDSASNDLWFAWHEKPDDPAFATSAAVAAQGNGKLAVVVLRERLQEFAASPLSALTRPALTLGKTTLFLSQ